MRFYYLTSGHIWGHDNHLIEGLKELGHEVIVLNEPMGKGALNRMKRKLRETIEETRKKNVLIDLSGEPDEAIFVGFTCPLFVLSAWMADKSNGKRHKRLRIIFNAVSSQYEANVISRETNKQRSLRAIRWWLIDAISFHLADKTLLESDAQVKFVQRFFLISQKKLLRSYSGIDEKEFYYDPSVQKTTSFSVLFRGRFLPESGILTVIEAAKKLEDKDVRFRIIGHGFLYREVDALMDKLRPSNVELFTKILPIEELRRKMIECHISLGQLADHPRLERTLPCKLFESLALKLPYLTGRNKAALELLEDSKTCITANPGDAEDLAEKILDFKNNPERKNRIGEAGFSLYKQKLTSKKIAGDIVSTCFP